MWIYKVKSFARFQRHEGIDDVSLAEAIRGAERTLIDADLGNGLIKQRVARHGQGKSGGFRTAIAYRHGERAVFLFGFAKSDRANLKPDELADLAQIGTRWLKANKQEIKTAIAANQLTEVPYDETD